MKRILISILLLLAFGARALAQGVSVQGTAIVNTVTPSVSEIPGNTVLQAIPGATITVCASTGGGIPCSPLVTIYSNAALTTVLANPFTADANGNFQFFVPPNTTGYIYSQTGTNVTGELFTVLPQTNLYGGISPTSQCTLTPVAPAFCGNGTGTSYQASPTLLELLPNTQTPWALTVAEANQAGNSGTTRKTFFGLATAMNGSVSFQQYVNGILAGQLLFDNTGAASLENVAVGNYMGPDSVGNVTLWPIANKNANVCNALSTICTTITVGTQCGTMSANAACANTTTPNEHCVSGIATLSGGASTITGISPAFTSNSTYIVLTSDVTTPGNANHGTPASGSSITFTGTGTDNIQFIACGG